MLKLTKQLDGTYLDEEGCTWDSKEEWFYVGILGFCGCGSTDSANKATEVFKLFTHGEYNIFDNEKAKKINPDYLDLILHIFDERGLTEHGGSVYGSWLEAKGIEILKILQGE